MKRPNLLAAFLLLAGLTLAYGEILRSLTSELDSRVEGGVVTLELAGLKNCDHAVLECFEGGGEHKDLLPTVFRQLVVDFGFLLLYPLALGLGCLLASRQLRLFGYGEVVGRALAAGQLVAGFCDLVENLALLRLLHLFQEPGSVARIDWGRMAAIFAATKFALVGLGIVFCAAAFVRWLLGSPAEGELLRAPGAGPGAQKPGPTPPD